MINYCNIIGIDPGRNGGISLITPNFYRSYKLPETDRDICLLLRELKEEFNPKVYLENVQANAGGCRTPQAAFNFGNNYGKLQGMVIANDISLTRVKPKDWLKFHGIVYPKKAGNTVKKNMTKGKAQELFPDINITHATSDALLIGYYGYHKENMNPSVPTK